MKSVFAKQQILSLTLPQEKTFDHFVPGDNQALIDQLTSLTPSSMLYLWGSLGSGCSHLLQAACHYWQQQGWYTLYLDLTETVLSQRLLNETLEGIQLVAIDHLESAMNTKKKEEFLFHLFNRAVQSHFAIIWSSHCPPLSLHGKLPDFISRLNSTLIFQVQNLNDLALQQALQKHAKQRGFKLKNDAAQFLLNHYPRDLTKLLALLNELDQFSLEMKRPLSIHLIKQWGKSQAV